MSAHNLNITLKDNFIVVNKVNLCRTCQLPSQLLSKDLKLTECIITRSNGYGKEILREEALICDDCIKEFITGDDQ